MIPTPLAFFWTPGTSGLNSLLEEIRFLSPERLRRHLSWRKADEKLATFLDFLDQNGALSALAPADWKQAFAAHLESLSNRHFLYFLWHARKTMTAPDEGSLPAFSTWLPTEIEAEFTRWQEQIEKDASLTTALRACARDPQRGAQFSYRGVNLLYAVEYTAIPSLVAAMTTGENTK